MIRSHTQLIPAASLLAMFAAVIPARPAALTGPQIIKRALNLQADITDYTATIKVTVDMPGLHIPQRTATLYFKRPDKLHVKSKGLVMVPRRALMMGDLGSEIANHARVILAGQARRDGVPIYFLKILPPPGQAASDRVLVWVRGDRFTIQRLEVWPGGRREITVTWEHQLVAGKYWLIKRLTAQLPARSPRRRRAADDPHAPLSPAAAGGTFSVQFSNYHINTGLPDSLFQEGASHARRPAP